MAYEEKIESYNPVAVRLGQNTIHAPEHDTWCNVKCAECGAEFSVGPNRNLGSRRTQQECVTQFVGILENEHAKGDVHLNAYDLGQ
jgi:hypothetical protein